MARTPREDARNKAFEFVNNGKAASCDAVLSMDELRELAGDRAKDSPLARLVGVVVAGSMLLAAAPVIFLLGLVIRLRDGGPMFYRGIRLGRFKKPFVMYKLRTLPIDAQQRLGAQLLRDRHGMVTPFTKFLRDTRLDELPQLLNVVRGEMNFVGPRPERPEVYEKLCTQIPGYNFRFLVRPGLMGYSQVFTPHGAPKRLRSHLDYRYIVNSRGAFNDLKIVLYTMAVLIIGVIRKTFRFFWRQIVMRRTHPTYSRRILERFEPKRGKAFLCTGEANACEFIGEFRLVDINEEAFRLLSDKPDDNEEHEFLLQKDYQKKGRLRTRVVRCKGRVYRRAVASEPATIIRYQAATPLNQYFLDKYFLHKSIV